MMTSMKARRTRAERAMSYDVVGAAASDRPMPKVAGYRVYDGAAHIGNGSACWEFASDAVLKWGVKTRSGFAIAGDDDRAAVSPVALGQRRWLIVNVGPFTIREPITVVAVVDEPDRKGFAYGTLAGHPGVASAVSRARAGPTLLPTAPFSGAGPMS